MKYLKYFLAVALVIVTHLAFDAKAANPIQYTPDVYPLLDSQYYSGTTTKAWLQVVTDGICLNGNCRTSWPSGGSASTTITVLGVDNDGPFIFNTGTPSTGLFLSVTSNGAGTITWNPQVATGYGIPLTASTTNWNTFYDTPSNRITAGTNLSWSGNTLNGIMASSTIIAGGTATHSPSVTFATSTDTNILLSVVCATSTCTFNPSWTGTLAAGRLNSNVVQAITNDTNVTGSISTQNLTLGWTGQLAVARGGTATSTTATSNGQLLGWHNASYGPWTLQAGSNITITTTTPGIITITGAAGGSGNSAWTIGNGLIYNATSTDLVGIGTITPTTTLFVQGKGGVNPFAIASSTGTQLLTVTQAGNVGIGTTAPAKLLHVFGNQPAGVALIERDTGTSTVLGTVYGTYGVRFWSATSSSAVLNGTAASQTFGYATPGGSVTLADFGAAVNTTAAAGKFLFRPYNTAGISNSVSSLTLDGYNSTAGIGSSTPYSNFVVQQGSGGILPVFTVATSTGATIFQVASGWQVLTCATCRLTIPQGTAPTLSAVGDIAVDTSNGGMFSFYANGRENLNATTTKGIMIETPSASENLSFFNTDVPITITKVTCLITSQVSNSPSWTFSLPHDTSRATAGGYAVSGQACTSTTTPQSMTLGGDLTMAANEILYATSSASSNASSTLIQVFFKYDN